MEHGITQKALSQQILTKWDNKAVISDKYSFPLENTATFPHIF